MVTMTELSQLILKDYQTRKRKKQKDQFIDLMQSHFPQLQVQQSRFMGNRNLILGDLKTASVIFAAHYDTCAQMPIPNFIAPKSILLSSLYSLLLVIPALLITLALDILIGLLISNFWVNYVANLVILAGLLVLMLAGKANNHTANDNTSGVITVLEIYQALTDEQRRKAAFVLFDNEEIGLIGSTLFRKQYKAETENTLLVNFDCVSDGDHILLALSKDAQKHQEAIAKAFTPTESKLILIENAEKIFYPSDQMGFPVSVAVAALHHKKGIGYYMSRIHTKKDVIFDEANITLLTNAAITLIPNIAESAPE